MIVLLAENSASVDYINYIFIEGGLTSWVLLGLSVAVLAWAMIMLFSCRRQTLCPPELYAALVDNLADANAPAARQLLDGDPSVLARMVQAGLDGQADGEPPDRVDAAMAKAGADQYARWGYRIGYLSMAAGVAPMLGLLGTVIGMMEAFASLGIGEKVTQQGELGAAIGKALITTYEGLVIAIPTLVIYAVLRHRLGLIMLDAASRADTLLGLWRQAKGGRSRT